MACHLRGCKSSWHRGKKSGGLLVFPSTARKLTTGNAGTQLAFCCFKLYPVLSPQAMGWLCRHSGRIFPSQLNLLGNTLEGWRDGSVVRNATALPEGGGLQLPVIPDSRLLTPLRSVGTCTVCFCTHACLCAMYSCARAHAHAHTR